MAKSHPTPATANWLHLSQHTLGTHRGSRRVWLEGKRLADAGFKAGLRYSADVQGDALVLRLSAAGDRKVSGSPKRPVVDLHPTAHLAALGTVERVEVSFYRRHVDIRVVPEDREAAARLGRLNRRLAAGQKLRLGSLCHGGGVSTDALLRGLGSAELSFALDYDEDKPSAPYLNQSLEHGPLSRGGRSIQASIAKLGRHVDELGEVEVLEAGLPCTAASIAGRSKKDLDRPEQDPFVGHLVYGFLRVIEATQPAVIVLENVPQYATSASADIIRSQLRDWGYDVHEHAIDGAAWSLEARQRWTLVAVTRGLDIDLASLQGGNRPATLGEVLDAHPAASAWRKTDGLSRKAQKDKALGRGFSRGRKLLDPQATSVPTLRRGYQKGGSCDVRLAHPTRAGVARLFSAAEHARIKGIDPRLVAGLSEKVAHEVLGQSVVAPAFVALGALVGKAVDA